jgi:hypothetical protein
VVYYSFHDVVDRSAVFYLHHKGASSLQSAFMKKIAGLCQNHEFGKLNSEVYSHLLSTIMIEAEIRMKSVLTLIWMAKVI